MIEYARGFRLKETMLSRRAFKLEFHGADTDTDADILAMILATRPTRAIS